MIKITCCYLWKILQRCAYKDGKIKGLKSTKTDAEKSWCRSLIRISIAAKYHGVVTIDDDVANRFLIRVVLYGKQE